MISGTAYGVALNDRNERAALAEAFVQPPYGKAPVAPVLYIKPRNTFAHSESVITLPNDVSAVCVGTTLGALFSYRSGAPVSAALAVDLFEAHNSYYRPAIRQRCRDGFLPLGRFEAWSDAFGDLEIVTRIDGVEAHRWSLARLDRAPRALIAELQAFMTLADGDLLLLGLAGDAPLAHAGQRIEVSANGFAPIRIELASEAVA